MASKLKCFNCGTNGHGVRECPDISCHYCHDRGHIVDNCPKKRHRSPTGSENGSCRNGRQGNNTTSASYNDHSRRLASGPTTNTFNSHHIPALGDSDKCFTCKEYGHRSESCGQTICHDCGRKGHIAKLCPSRKEAKETEKKCYFCKRKGHQIADCSLKKQYPQEEKLCYMCLKPGHHANECNNEAVCHMCSGSGHISSDCPNRECTNCHSHGHSVGKCPSVRCFRCNENGHMANECEDEVIGVSNADHSSGSVARNSVAITGPASQVSLSALALQQHTLQQQMAYSPPPPPVSTGPPAHLFVQQVLQRQFVSPIPPMEDTGSRPVSGRVCVLIDGPYFEASVKQVDSASPDYARVRLALQHALQFIGAIFDKTPYGFWFDMDPSSLSEFVEQEFTQPQRDATMRRLNSKHTELIMHMCSGRGLSNVVTRLVGKIRHRPIVSSLGMGSSWMPAGIDVAIGTSIVECFESKQFNQVVLLSGDGALCPPVDYCNTRRQDGAKAPVRVCGCMATMDSLFGSRQELVDFLPRIFLDSPEHFEEGKRVGFPISTAFQ